MSVTLNEKTEAEAAAKKKAADDLNAKTPEGMAARHSVALGNAPVATSLDPPDAGDVSHKLVKYREDFTLRTNEISDLTDQQIKELAIGGPPTVKPDSEVVDAMILKSGMDPAAFPAVPEADATRKGSIDEKDERARMLKQEREMEAARQRDRNDPSKPTTMPAPPPHDRDADPKHDPEAGHRRR